MAVGILPLYVVQAGCLSLLHLEIPVAPRLRGQLDVFRGGG